MPAKKKTTPRKTAAKKATKKRTSRKTATKKTATKKTARKATAKKATRKSATKKPSARKAAKKNVATNAEEPAHNLSISASAKNLLGKLPPDLRDKVLHQIKTHGPTFALATIQKLEPKTKNPKLKMALKGLSAILAAIVVKRHKS